MRELCENPTRLSESEVKLKEHQKRQHVGWCTVPDCTTSPFSSTIQLHRLLVDDHGIDAISIDAIGVFMPKQTERRCMQQQPCLMVAREGSSCTRTLYNSFADMVAHLKSKQSDLTEDDARNLNREHGKYETREISLGLRKRGERRRELVDG